MSANIQQASVIKDFRRVYIMILKAEPAGKRFCLFCASSDERRHGKFTVVLARAVNFIWVLEERRDNAIMNNEGKGESMVQINGEQVEASKVVGKTLLAYVTEAGYDPVGIVIEKNMEIIHREDFDKVNIADEDVIEILHFVGGGQF